MKRKPVYIISCAVFSLVLVSRFLSAYNNKEPFRAGHAPVTKPNVLFILVDDLRPELNCYGQTQILSPNIDRLAASGMLFTRAYCQQAVCSPSRTSMLTGLRPDSTKVYDLTTHFRKTIPAVITLPQHFRQQGYYTAGLGKIFHSLELEDKRSWSEAPYRPLDSMWNIQRGYLLEKNIRLALKSGDGRGPAYEIGPNDQEYPDDWIVNRAIAKLKELQGQPFFLAVGLNKPHLPFNAPARFWKLYENRVRLSPLKEKPIGSPPVAFANSGELRAYQAIPKGRARVNDSLALRLKQGYYASVSYTDANVGRLLNELKNSGLDKTTIVVLWGDHGFKLGEYGEWCKHSNSEWDTHLPLIISVPGMRNKGARTAALVESIDIYPTLVQLAGLPEIKTQGLSLKPILNRPSSTLRDFAVSQYPRDSLMGYSFRTANWHFVRWGIKGSPGKIKYLELYDCKKDPGETVNQAANMLYATVLKELMTKSDKFLNIR